MLEHRTFTLDVNGTVNQTRSDVSLDSRQTDTGSFTYTPTSDDGSAINFSVSSLNTTDSAIVERADPAFFEVSITDTNEPVTEGDTAFVDYEINNTGDLSGTQNISFTVDNQSIDSERLTLDGAGSETGTFAYQTVSGDAPSINATVNSTNQSASTDLAVNEPANLSLSVTNITDPVTEGDNITVDYNVTNTGDLAGEDDIEFSVDGATVATDSVSVDGDESINGSFSYQTSEGDSPSVDIALESSTETITETVTVQSLAFFDVSITR